jgi:hypothetical protein
MEGFCAGKGGATFLQRAMEVAMEAAATSEVVSRLGLRGVYSVEWWRFGRLVSVSEPLPNPAVTSWYQSPLGKGYHCWGRPVRPYGKIGSDGRRVCSTIAWRAH